MKYKEFRIKVLPEDKNFLGLEDKYSGFENSKIVILPCPYEKTTSYGRGTARGPEAILQASHYVEFFDEETLKEICFSFGIATLKPPEFRNLGGRKAIDYIYNVIKSLISLNKFVVTLGGEHSISSATFKAHYESYGNLSLLHFDAHSDLRDSYQGSKYSHACFAARIAEYTTNITQIGIRAQCREEHDLIKESGINTYYAHYIRSRGFKQELINEIISTLNDNVYITFDVDYFDPSIMPSTGTPEPNGFYWDETMRFIREVSTQRKIVGFDVVELSPVKNLNFPNYLTAKLIYRILNYIF